MDKHYNWVFSFNWIRKSFQFFMSNNLYYELEKFLIIHVAVRQLRYDDLVSNLHYCRHNSSDNTVKVFVWLNLIFIEKILVLTHYGKVFDCSVLDGNNNLIIYHQKDPLLQGYSQWVWTLCECFLLKLASDSNKRCSKEAGEWILQLVVVLLFCCFSIIIWKELISNLFIFVLF
jgi:hypothetical protein